MKRSKKFRALCLLMSLSVISGMVASCSLPTTTTKQADVTAKHDTRGDDYVEPDTPDVTEEPTIITTEESEKPLSDSDFEIKEYSYTNILDDSMYFLIIKNNSSQTVSINGNIIVYDKKNEELGADSGSIDVLGPGDESIMEFYFDDVKGIKNAKYTLTYDPTTDYTSGLSDVKFKVKKKKKGVVVTATNNGDEATKFLEAHALFFDKKGKVIYHTTHYLVDKDYELKPGATLAEQLNAYKKYKKVEVYYTARRGGWF